MRPAVEFGVFLARPALSWGVIRQVPLRNRL
jgi:hypothetical protein